MSSYADIMKIQVASLSSARVVALNALSNALALRGDFTGGEEELRNLRGSLASMVQSTETAEGGMSGMRAATESLPRISKELNKARRAVVTQLDALLAEIDSTRSTVSNIIDAIDRMLQSSRPTASAGDA